MGASYFLADSRYMTPDELELAYKFDHSALICHSRSGRDEAGFKRFVYSLEIHNIHFFNLPRDITLVNSGDDFDVNTLGDLIDQIRRVEGIIVPVHVLVERDREVREGRYAQQTRGGVTVDLSQLTRASQVLEYITR